MRSLNLVAGLRGPSLGSKQGEVSVWFLGAWGEEKAAQALALGSGGRDWETNLIEEAPGSCPRASGGNVRGRPCDGPRVLWKDRWGGSFPRNRKVVTLQAPLSLQPN